MMGRPPKPRGTRVVDRFAEALAECGDVPAAGAQLGLGRHYANTLFDRIKSELGREQGR